MKHYILATYKPSLHKRRTVDGLKRELEFVYNREFETQEVISAFISLGYDYQDDTFNVLVR